MNISKTWLQDYLDLTCDDHTLCDKLTMAGIEVESVNKRSQIPDGVIAAEIRSRTPHPSSDHLSVCKVFDGTNELQIVCGAPNCNAGLIVPLATIGTRFSTPEGEFKIKKSKLRGVESNGMMCSENELGLGTDNSGLMILDSSIKPGTPLTSLFPGDTQMELEITPNRPDCLSMWGVARDLSCLLSVPAKLPVITIPECNNSIPDLVSVESPELCPRYIGRVIEGVKVGPSPKWLVERLESIGLRSINNVVDVTNFVMMELGQPLHAFDRNKLAGKRVVVRSANPDETITILDGRTLKLENRHLVIADSEKPMAIAGIMGGMHSGVTETTTSILLESAVFFSSNIRATSRELGISTDASYRYERGVDYDMAELASQRACQLILATAGGHIASAAVDINTGRPTEKVISCRFDKIRNLIGTTVSNERIVEILQGLYLKVSDITAIDCKVTVPLFRLDLEREADLAEEVERIDGLDKIPLIPVAGKICHPDSEDAYNPIRKLRDLMIGLGLYECMHYSIVSSSSAFSDSRFTQEDVITLDNPINPETSIMRPSLLGELLGTIGRNFSRGNRDLRLFELDQAFCKNPQKYPEERYELIFALTGRRNPELYGCDGESKFDFYDIKGMVESILDLLGISNYRFGALPDDKRYKNGHAAALEVEGKKIGSFGEISEHLMKSWRSTDPVFTAQIDVEPLLVASGHVKHIYKALAQYPIINRDVAFIAPAILTHGEIVQFIRKANPLNLAELRLFDIFVDKEMKQKGVKSMAYTLSFRHAERTLTDNEVNVAMDKLRKKLVSDLKVELR